MPEGKAHFQFTAGHYFAFCVVSFLASVIEAGYEVAYWLKHGYKAGLSLFHVSVVYLGDDLQRLYNPTDWVGLCRLLQHVVEVDLWIIFLVMAVAFFMLFAYAASGDEPDKA